MTFWKHAGIAIAGLAVLCGGAVLLTPRAVHALAAALVQVTNTAAAPAITEDVSKLAAQSNQVWCPFSFVGCFAFPAVGTAYTVPANRTFMVTTVDFVWQGATAPTANFYTLYCGASFTGSNEFGEWSLAGGTAPTQFLYPTGLPVPAGCAVNTISAHQSNYDVILRGYLTAN